VNLSDFTAKDLKIFAHAEGIVGHYKMRKTKLVKALITQIGK